MKKKIIIFLNGLRGIHCLENILTNNYEILSAVTPNSFFSSVFLHLKEKYKFKHIKSDNVNEKDFIKYLREIKPNIFLIIGFSQIFSKDLFTIPTLGTYNFHAGKLPFYRGGSPINWQIINNENEIGISIIKVNEKIDGGAIALSHSLKYSNTDYVSDIHLKINNIFSNLSIELLKKITKKEINLVSQNEKKAKYWHQRNDSDGYIDFSKLDAENAFNFIRAISHPYSGAWGMVNKIYKIRFFESDITDFNLKGTPGRICFIQNKGPYIICKDRGLLIKDYLIESSEKQKLNNSDHVY